MRKNIAGLDIHVEQNGEGAVELWLCRPIIGGPRDGEQDRLVGMSILGAEALMDGLATAVLEAKEMET